MPLINAFRMDGLGNRFIIIDRREKSINIPKEKIIHLGNLKSLFIVILNLIKLYLLKKKLIILFQ